MNFYEHAYDDDDGEDEDERGSEEHGGNGSDSSGLNPCMGKQSGAALGSSTGRGGNGSKRHRPMEGVCGPGDVLFVPSGWWHMALNLEAWSLGMRRRVVGVSD
jgi:hypothetical protein